MCPLIKDDDERQQHTFKSLINSHQKEEKDVFIVVVVVLYFLKLYRSSIVFSHVLTITLRNTPLDSNHNLTTTCGFTYYTHHPYTLTTVSYTHLRAHETPEHLVCRLLLEKKKKKKNKNKNLL
eukprot:TRINITY_DN1579_c0_g2_i3.p1 TRINITY_DN1579_c0_g2~~TRINITY_DN1579_c0_g2_i3.p1  ORF type:complete len:123 (+),score=11.49 TRINITY_DN1579_c0_g2_i3:162-530(+)